MAQLTALDTAIIFGYFVALIAIGVAGVVGWVIVLVYVLAIRSG